jgi:molybdopterin synthase catalytic subunit
MIENIQENIFIEGAIPVDLITEILLHQNRNTHTGAYSIFVGQVRDDEIGGSRVSAVEFTTHTEMALEKFHEIKRSICAKYPLADFLAFHSVGRVLTGEICFFVLASSVHRGEAIKACQEAVERIKAEMAIWGKLLLENETAKWKENN